MIPAHFMLPDLLGTLLGICLFPLVLLAPGYVAGWFGNLLGFRRRSPVLRLLLGVTLSMALVPYFTYVTARFGGFTTVWSVFLLIWLLFLGLVALHIWTRASGGSAGMGLLLSLAFGLMFLVIFSLVDLQFGQRLYTSVLAADYSKHIAVADAITSTGVPPANPSFFPGRPLSLFYYYFWYLICSLVDRLGAELVAARHAVFAGTAWTGFAFLALLGLYMRFLHGWSAGRGRQKTLLALSLLLVTGVDVVPVMLGNLYSLSERITLRYASVEGWNHSGQVTSWLGSLLWVPQHVAGLTAGLMGLLLIWPALGRGAKPPRARATVAAAVAFASALGLSVWVTLPFAIFLALLLAAAALRGRWRMACHLALVGMLTVALSSPFLLDLYSANQRASVAPIVLAVRPFALVTTLRTMLPALDVPWLTTVLNLLFLPVNYLLELGFFAVAAALYWSSRVEKVPERDSVYLLLFSVSFLFSTFFKSNLQYNDLGWRSFLPAQFILLLWATEWVAAFLWRRQPERRPSWQAAMVAGLLLLGVWGTAYEVVVLRSAPVLADLHSPERRGEHLYRIREAYAWVNKNLPPAAIVQHNPAVWLEQYHGLYGERQVVVADKAQGELFGVDPALLAEVALPVAELFWMEEEVTIAQVEKVCQRRGIDVLLVKNSDRAWQKSDSWVWRMEPLYDNGHVRLIACHDRSAER